VGKIGSLIAENVLKGNLPLMIFDVSKEAMEGLVSKGAIAGESPRDVAGFADVIALSVKDDQQVRDVVLSDDGILAGAKPGSVILVHSTIEPETAASLGETCASKGVAVVDAPLSGGPEGATARTLLYMVGGEA